MGARDWPRDWPRFGARVCSPVLAVAVAAAACGERKQSAATAGAAAAEPSGQDRWRYGKALAAASEGAVVSPVLELSMGDRGRAQVVAVAQRSGSPEPPVTVEIWTFEQRGEDLAPVGEPTVLHELRAGEHAPADRDERLAELRRDRAAPGTVVERPLGLQADDPSALFGQLVALAATTVDPAAAERARVDAAAILLRGIDDSLAFSGRLPALTVALASASPSAVGIAPLSDRRVRVTSGTQTFEVWKAGSGWVLARWE